MRLRLRVRRKRLILILVFFLLSGVILYLLYQRFLTYERVRTYIIQTLERRIHREIIADSWSPWTIKGFAVNRVVIKDRSGFAETPLMEADRIEFSYDLLALIKGKKAFRIRIQRPVLSLKRRGKEWNIADLMKGEAEAGKRRRGPISIPFFMDGIEISDGSFRYEDGRGPMSIDQIELKAYVFLKKASLKIWYHSKGLNGRRSPITLEALIRLSGEKIEGKGTFKIQGIHLEEVAYRLPRGLPAGVASPFLEIEGAFSFPSPGPPSGGEQEALAAGITIHGRVGLSWKETPRFALKKLSFHYRSYLEHYGKAFRVDLSGIHAALAKGSVTGNLSYSSPPRGSLSFDLKAKDTVFPPAFRILYCRFKGKARSGTISPEENRWSGRFSFEGLKASIAPEALFRPLELDGKVDFDLLWNKGQGRLKLQRAKLSIDDLLGGTVTAELPLGGISPGPNPAGTSLTLDLALNLGRIQRILARLPVSSAGRVAARATFQKKRKNTALIDGSLKWSSVSLSIREGTIRVAGLNGELPYSGLLSIEDRTISENEQIRWGWFRADRIETPFMRLEKVASKISYRQEGLDFKKFRFIISQGLGRGRGRISWGDEGLRAYLIGRFRDVDLDQMISQSPLEGISLTGSGNGDVKVELINQNIKNLEGRLWIPEPGGILHVAALQEDLSRISFGKATIELRSIDGDVMIDVYLKKLKVGERAALETKDLSIRDIPLRWLINKIKMIR